MSINHPAKRGSAAAKTMHSAPLRQVPQKTAPRRQGKTLLFMCALLGVSTTIVGFRINDIWLAATGHSRFAAITEALAESTPQKPAENAPIDLTPKHEDAKDGEKKIEHSESAQTTEHKDEAHSNPDLPRTQPDDLNNSSEMLLIKELTDRRALLDKRAKDLDTREALINVAEQRVDQKIKEMQTLRTQLQSLVNNANEAQQAQLDNLVKIYEVMKPKEAARIFDTLEMPTLLGVVQRMKPAKTSAIMAEMSPEKAKDITMELTKQEELPQIK